MKTMDVTTIALVVLDICLLAVGCVLIPTLLKVSRVLGDISKDVKTFAQTLQQILNLLQEARIASEQVRGEVRGLQREIEHLKEKFD